MQNSVSTSVSGSGAQYTAAKGQRQASQSVAGCGQAPAAGSNAPGHERQQDAGGQVSHHLQAAGGKVVFDAEEAEARGKKGAGSRASE